MKFREMVLTLIAQRIINLDSRPDDNKPYMCLESAYDRESIFAKLKGQTYVSELSVDLIDFVKKTDSRLPLIESLENILSNLKKLHIEYDEHPENHPLYGNEWQSFCSRRHGELTKMKAVENPNDFDYRPEWQVFWSARMKHLMEQEIERAKTKFQSKHRLEDDKLAEILSLISNPFANDDAQPVNPQKRAKAEKQFIAFQLRRPEKRSTSAPRKRPAVRLRSEISRTFHNCSIRFSDSSNTDASTSKGLLLVCRNLAVLEEELGSMVSSNLGLLQKAIVAEKTKLHSADDLLRDMTIVVTLETIRQKFIGIIDAGISARADLVQRSITDIERLVANTNGQWTSEAAASEEDLSSNEIDILSNNLHHLTREEQADFVSYLHLIKKEPTG